jgi:hypothetical protein
VPDETPVAAKPTRRARTPQDDKALSYLRDRRNDYGENDKSSRKNIRRNTRHPNRSDRHRAGQDLVAAAGPVDLVRAEEAAERTQRRRSAWDVARWRKVPDAPLGEFVRSGLRRRVRMGIDDPETAGRRIERIERTERAVRGSGRAAPE